MQVASSCGSAQKSECGSPAAAQTRVAQQRLVEDHGQAVTEGRHAADRVAGGRAYLLRGCLADLGDVEGVGQLARVDTVRTRGDADDRVTVGNEHDRLRDLSVLASDGGWSAA